MELPSLVNQPFSTCALVREGEGELLVTNANIPWTAAGMLAVILINFFTQFSSTCDILDAQILAIIVVCFDFGTSTISYSMFFKAIMKF